MFIVYVTAGASLLQKVIISKISQIEKLSMNPDNEMAS
jgi:hypothetical protein